MARSFDDASSEYLETDSSPITGLPVTLACWFSLDDVAADHTFVYTGDKDVNDDWFALRFDQSENHIRFVAKSGGSLDNVWSSWTPAADGWHHVAGMAIASNNRRILVDGANSGDTNVGRSPTGLDRVSIGRMGDSTPGKYMDGLIAEVAMWDAALTDAEVAILAAGYSPLFVRPQNLVAYWPLISDEDQDRVGGYDLTAYNTPTIAAHPPVIYPAQIHQSFSAAAEPPAGYPIPEALHSYRQRRT